MKKKSSPQVYAQAALKAAVASWEDALESLYEKVQKDDDFRIRISDPAVSIEERLKLVREAVPKMPSETLNFVGVLMQNGDLNMLGGILDELDKLSEVEVQPVLAEVVTAVPLSEEERKALEEKIRKEFGGNLVFRFEVDPDILGGLIVRVGDRLVDSSVAGRLRELRQALGVTE